MREEGQKCREMAKNLSPHINKVYEIQASVHEAIFDSNNNNYKKLVEKLGDQVKSISGKLWKYFSRSWLIAHCVLQSGSCIKYSCLEKLKIGLYIQEIILECWRLLVNSKTRIYIPTRLPEVDTKSYKINFSPIQQPT